MAGPCDSREADAASSAVDASTANGTSEDPSAEEEGEEKEVMTSKLEADERATSTEEEEAAS